MSAHGCILHRVGDVTPMKFLHSGGAIKVTIDKLTGSGATIVLEHLNEPVTTEVGSPTQDASYTTNQSKASFSGTVGQAYRLRCTVAPTASKSPDCLLEM